MNKNYLNILLFGHLIFDINHFDVYHMLYIRNMEMLLLNFLYLVYRIAFEEEILNINMRNNNSSHVNFHKMKILIRNGGISILKEEFLYLLLFQKYVEMLQ